MKIKVKMSLVYTIRGILIALAVVSLYQDIVYGTAERFAAHILDGGWTDKSITVPLAILYLVVAWSLVRMAEKQLEEQDKEEDKESSNDENER